MAAVCIDISINFSLLFSFSAGRKEDETDEKWIEKERERAQKEREREEKGKETQMLFLVCPPCITTFCTIMSNYTRKEHGHDLGSKVLTDNRSQVLTPSDHITVVRGRRCDFLLC